MNEISLFLEILIYIVSFPIFLAVAVIFAWGAWNMFLAPLFEFALCILFGEPGDLEFQAARLNTIIGDIATVKIHGSGTGSD